MEQRKYGARFWAKGLLCLLTVMFIVTIISRAAASFTVAQVTVNTPSARKLTYQVQVEGRVEKNRELAVMGQAELLVKGVYVSEGQRVEKGEILAEIDREQLMEQIRYAEGEKESLVLQNQALQTNRGQIMEKRKREIARAKDDYEQMAKQIKKAVLDANSQLRAETREAKRAWEDACQKPDVDNSIRINRIAMEKLGLTLKKLEEIKNAGGMITAPENGVVSGIFTETGQKTSDTALFLIEDEKKQKTAVVSQPDLFVKRVCVAEGQRIKKGDVLAELDMSQLQERIDAVRGEYQTLELQNQALEKNREQLAEKRQQEISRTREDYNRARAKNGTGGSSAEIDALKKQQQEAERAWKDACQKPDVDNTVAMNEIALKQWELKLKKLEEIQKRKGKILAPENGVITSVSAAVGQKTAEGAMFTMTDDSEGLKFAGQMAPEDARYLSVGDTASLEAAGKTSDNIAVTTLEMDEGKEFINVTALLPAKTFSLGESASLSVIQESRSYACTVPVTALHQEKGKYYVLVMENEETVLGKQDVARQMEVTVLEKNQTYAALESGVLKEDSRIITETDRYVGDGDRIRQKEEGGEDE